MYVHLFDNRRTAYLRAIDELKARSEWEPLRPVVYDGSEESIKKQIEIDNAKKLVMADTMLAALLVRVGKDEDRQEVSEGTSLGNSSLTEMETDLVAVDGLKTAVLLKLQEMSLSVEPKPVKRMKISEFFEKPIRTQTELDATIEKLRVTLQECIDKEMVIILE